MPAMPRAHGNGVELEYETVGDPAGRPLLLVQGLGSQLISVEDGLCRELAGRGFLVIRYDNRDVGLSTWFDHARPVNLAAIWGGDPSSLAYTLEDMADDAAAVLDAAGVASAHVAGISLGGMIAQLLATRYPDRVRSLADTGLRRGGARARKSVRFVEHGRTAAVPRGALAQW